MAFRTRHRFSSVWLYTCEQFEGTKIQLLVDEWKEVKRRSVSIRFRDTQMHACMQVVPAFHPPSPDVDRNDIATIDTMMEDSHGAGTSLCTILPTCLLG